MYPTKVNLLAAGVLGDGFGALADGVLDYSKFATMLQEKKQSIILKV